jgi:hypothetical protein
MHSEAEIVRRVGKYGKTNVDGYGNIIYPIDVQRRKEYLIYLSTNKRFEELESQRIYKTKAGGKYDITMRKHMNGVGMVMASVSEKKEIVKVAKEYSYVAGRLIYYRKYAYQQRVKRILMNNELFNRRFELIDYFTRYFSVHEVLRIVKEDWSFNRCERSDIESFYKEYREEIKAAQEEYKNSIDEIRLVYKRSRLDELLDLYNDRRLIYIKQRKQSDYRLLLMTLEQVRKEVEGERVTVDAAFKVQLEKEATVHQEEIMRTLPIKMMILSLVAGRAGQNPQLLMSKLAESYYAKYTGYSGQIKAYDGDDITFPSEFIYNMDEMRELAQRHIEEDMKAEEEFAEPKLTIEVEEIKNSLLAELLTMKEAFIEEKKSYIEEVRVSGTDERVKVITKGSNKGLMEERKAAVRTVKGKKFSEKRRKAAKNKK